MKKIYSLAVMVMMAMCAMVVSSCGNDDDTKSSNTDKSAIYTVSYDEIRFAGTQTVAEQQTMKNNIASTVAEFYGKIVADANLGTYDATTKQITIKSSALENAKKAISNADKSNLKAAFDKISGLMHVYVILKDQDGNTLNESEYSYNKISDASFSIGTWEWENAAKDSTIIINIIEKSAESNNSVEKYTAVVTVTSKAGTKSYNALTYHTSLLTFGLTTNDKNADGVRYVTIGGKFTEADPITELVADVDVEGDEVETGITFKKQTVGK